MTEPSSRSADQFFPGLFSVLLVLEPYLAAVVLVGGWVPYLLARAGSGMSAHEQVFTRDIDIAIRLDSDADGRRIDGLLLEAGLECDFRSMDDLPVVVFVGAINGAEVEVEFLADEPGERERVVKVGDCLHVQTLHYTRILEANTTTVAVVGPDGRVLVVRIPSVAAFVLNKGLTFVQRKTKEKKAKDLYYLFEMLENQSDSLAEDIARLAERYPAWYKTFKKNLSRFFGRIEDEGAFLVVSQRPAGAFVELSDDQLAQYVFATFSDFLRRLS